MTEGKAVGCLRRAVHIFGVGAIVFSVALLSVVYLASWRADKELGTSISARYPEFEVESVSAHSDNVVSYVLQHRMRPDLFMLVRVFKWDANDPDLQDYQPPHEVVVGDWVTNETYIASLDDDQMDAFIDAYERQYVRANLLIHVLPQSEEASASLDVYVRAGRSLGEAAHSTLNANRHGNWTWTQEGWVEESAETGFWRW